MLALVSCFGLRQRSRTIREPACRRVVILRQRYVNQHVIIVVRCGEADEKVRAGKATPGTPSRTLLVCTERRKGWVVAGPGVDLCMCQVKGCRHVHSRVRVVGMSAAHDSRLANRWEIWPSTTHALHAASGRLLEGLRSPVSARENNDTVHA